MYDTKDFICKLGIKLEYQPLKKLWVYTIIKYILTSQFLASL